MRRCAPPTDRPALAATLLAVIVVTLASLPGAGSARTRVVVTIPPQAFFVERIGGDLVEVDVLVGPGQSPHSYEATPKQMARLVEADVYFTTGMPFEDALIERIHKLASDIEIVATDYPVPKRRMTLSEFEHGEHHLHDEHHEQNAESQDDPSAPATHDGGRPDPHVWMDPGLVKIQARVIAPALIRANPDHEQAYLDNLEAFLEELDALDARIADTLSELHGTRLYVFHPAFGYFADAYGLVQVPVETGGKEPSARRIAQLIERAREDGARMIFVQPQFSTLAAEAIAEAIGGAVVPIDPLARDYVANLERIADVVRKSLEGSRR